MSGMDKSQPSPEPGLQAKPMTECLYVKETRLLMSRDRI